MQFDFHPSKARSNAAKHGVSFDLARTFDFGSAMIEADIVHSDVEDRLRAYGLIGDRVHVMVFIIRRPVIWVISLRKANVREIRRYARES